MKLEEIKQHETRCLYGTVKCGGENWGCVGCGRHIPIKTFATHRFLCFSNSTSHASLNKGERFEFGFSDRRLAAPWDGAGALRYDSDICIAPWHRRFDGQDFFLKLFREHAEKRWVMFVGLAGNDEDCARYRAVVTMTERESKIDTVLPVDVGPLDDIFTMTRVKESGAFCSLTDRAMEKFLTRRLVFQTYRFIDVMGTLKIMKV